MEQYEQMALNIGSMHDRAGITTKSRNVFMRILNSASEFVH